MNRAKENIPRYQFVYIRSESKPNTVKRGHPYSGAGECKSKKIPHKVPADSKIKDLRMRIQRRTQPHCLLAVVEQVEGTQHCYRILNTVTIPNPLTWPYPHEPPTNLPLSPTSRSRTPRLSNNSPSALEKVVFNEQSTNYKSSNNEVGL